MFGALTYLTSSAPGELRKNKTHLGFSVFVHPTYSGLGHRYGALGDLCNSNKTIAVALQSVITQIIHLRLSPASRLAHLAQGGSLVALGGSVQAGHGVVPNLQSPQS